MSEHEADSRVERKGGCVCVYGNSDLIVCISDLIVRFVLLYNCALTV